MTASHSQDDGAPRVSATASQTSLLAHSVIAALLDRELTVAVAESLTGGWLTGELVAVPGASGVVVGGVVAYNTALKHSVLGVDAGLLARTGPVDADVAIQMAIGVRRALAVDGRPADIGLSTTGVAGPGAQDGHPAGTVYLGFAIGEHVSSLRLALEGDREAIRRQSVYECLLELNKFLHPE